MGLRRKRVLGALRPLDVDAGVPLLDLGQRQEGGRGRGRFWICSQRKEGRHGALKCRRNRDRDRRGA
jgi:hypothetical protein